MPTSLLNAIARLQGSFLKHTEILNFLLFTGLCVLLANSGIAGGSESTAPQSIEITVRLYPQIKRLELIDQVIVNRAAPKHRDTRLQRGELLVQCENEVHENIGRLAIPDPSLIRSEWPDETAPVESPGLLRGKYIHSEATVFQIVVPWDNHFTYLRLLKLKKNSLTKISRAISYKTPKALKTTITDDQLETIAFTRIDHSKNATFRKSRPARNSRWGKRKTRRNFDD